MSKSAKHLLLETLLELADGRETAGARASAHLADCGSCRDELHRLENYLAVMKEDRSADAPRDLLAFAINSFAARHRKPSLVERIVAALSFDSFDRQAAFGVRAAETSGRQLIYSAGESDIDLRINQTEDDRWILAGQVLGAECEGREIKLQSQEHSTSAYLNEQCEFTLPAVPAGTYELILRLANVEVEVPQLKIGV